MKGAEPESSLAAFRAEVRHFLQTHLPPDIRRKTELGLFHGREDLLRWHRILHAQGWVAPAWPRSHGGAEWSPEQRHIFEEEAAEAGAPPLIPMALTIVGPLVIWLMRRDDMPFAADQAKETLNFQITVYLAGLICGILMLLVIGFFLAFILVIAHIVLTLVAAVKASEGVAYSYPFNLRLIS